jgi:hypothetical protein
LPLAFIFRAFGALFRLFVQSPFMPQRSTKSSKDLLPLLGFICLL